MENSASVCVIGAGVAGLLAVKYCLEYGFSVQCYEMRPTVGGIWTGVDPSVQPNDSNGRAWTTVHDAVTLNTSQFLTTFSDFPLPDDLMTPSRFLHASSFLEYLNRFARHFGLHKHIQFSSKVLRVFRVGEDLDSKWAVTVLCNKDGKYSEITTYHQHVLIASGLYADAFVPEVPGMNDTSVTCVHSAHVRETKATFESKRVLVVGGSISAGDIAQAAVTAGAKKVTWAVTRDPGLRSIFVMFRHPFGKRFAWDEWGSLFGYSVIPLSWRLWLFSGFFNPVHAARPNAVLNFAHDRFIVQDAEIFDPARANGVLEIIPTSIGQFCGEGRSVQFMNQTRQEFDVCVFGTGFSPRYSFLGEEVFGAEGLKGLTLNRHMIPVNEGAWGLKFIFTSSIAGSGVVGTEMEVRWLVHNLANGIAASSAQREALLAEKEHLAKPFENAFYRRSCPEVVNARAQELKCIPSPYFRAFFSPFPRERRLAALVAFGPWVPQIYRLEGPHAKPDVAREAILRVSRFTMGLKFEIFNLLMSGFHLFGAVGLLTFAYFNFWPACRDFFPSVRGYFLPE